MSINKHKYWQFIIYPESAVNDWRDVITERGLCFAVSPLHEYDLTSEGELKKPHHHVILPYPASTTYNNVKALTVDELGGTIPKVVDNVRGAYEYLTHKNHPQKFQYSDDEIELHNGFDIVQLAQESAMEKAVAKISILNDIKTQHIFEYCDLLDYYSKLEDYEKFLLASNNTLFFNTYITSIRHKQKKKRILENEE